MRRGLVAFLALAGSGLALVGCGRFGFETREAWREQAESACLAAKLVAPSAYMSRIGEIDGPGACGISYPFAASALAGGSVGLTNRLTLACPIISEVDAWLNGTVQPAAEIYFGQTVIDIRAGSYSCRSVNNQYGAKKSEHAFGNAVDVFSFRLADGRLISVEKGWRGDPTEQDFLREVFVGACRHFSTVLAPGSDAFHYNHFHLDLARRGTRGAGRSICRPAVKFEPRLDPERAAERLRQPPKQPVSVRPEPEDPLEIEDDRDPFAVSSAPSRPQTGAVSARPRIDASALASPGRPAAARAPQGVGQPLVLQPRLGAALDEE